MVYSCSLIKTDRLNASTIAKDVQNHAAVYTAPEKACCINACKKITHIHEYWGLRLISLTQATNPIIVKIKKGKKPNIPVVCSTSI